MNIARAPLRVLYVNSNLARPATAPGLWGWQVLMALRTAGADVRCLPAIPDLAAPAGNRSGRWSRIGKHAAAVLPTRIVAWLLECYLMGRGLANSLRTAAYVWREPLATAVPQARPALTAYGETIDRWRARLEERLAPLRPGGQTALAPRS